MFIKGGLVQGRLVRLSLLHPAWRSGRHDDVQFPGGRGAPEADDWVSRYWVGLGVQDRVGCAKKISNSYFAMLSRLSEKIESALRNERSKSFAQPRYLQYSYEN